MRRIPAARGPPSSSGPGLPDSAKRLERYFFRRSREIRKRRPRASAGEPLEHNATPPAAPERARPAIPGSWRPEKAARPRPSFRVDDLASDNRYCHARFENLRRFHGHNIVGQNDEIRELAGRNRPLAGFFKGRVGSFNGPAPQRFLARHALFRKPAAGRVALTILARDRRIESP